MKKLSILFVAASALCFVPRADAAPPDSLSYALNTPPSDLENGCMGPCECPVDIHNPTYGSFDLIRLGADPTYTYYEIHRYIASFNNGPGAVSVVGTGTLKIDGKAGMQEMTLDVDVWGQPEHFDSGVVPITVPFPQIHAACAVHAFACMDSVITVDATPLDQVSVGGTPPHRFGIASAWPNPFERGTSLWLDLGRSGPVDLEIIDLSGRVTRVLAAGRTLGKGGEAVSWDGRTGDGRVAPAGVYWAVLRWSGGMDRHRLVKLD